MSGLDLVAVLGVVLVAVGLGLWWLPAALIWTGGAMIAGSFLTGYANGRDNRDI